MGSFILYLQQIQQIIQIIDNLMEEQIGDHPNQKMQEEAVEQSQVALNNRISEQQNQKINAFFRIPYNFVAPPIQTNQQKTCYRKNIEECIEPMTNIIKFFTSETVEIDSINVGQSLNEILNAEKQMFPKINLSIDDDDKNSEEKSADEIEDVMNTPIAQVKGDLKLIVYTIFSGFHAILKDLYQGTDENDCKSTIQSLTLKINNFFILCEKIRVYEARKIIMQRMQAETPKILEATRQINEALKEIEEFVSQQRVEREMEEEVIQERNRDGESEENKKNSIHHWDNYLDI